MTAEQIKAARLAKNMTQKEFASWIGKSLSTVTKWEGGAPIPDWVAEKLKSPQTRLQITELTAEEISKLEKKAAAKGMSGDAFVAEMLRSFLKLTSLLLLALHFCCSGADFSGKALASTGKTALGFVSSLIP